MRNVFIAGTIPCATHFPLQFAARRRVPDVSNLDHLFWSTPLYKCLKHNLTCKSNCVMACVANKNDHSQI